jgi:hypothetical protein
MTGIGDDVAVAIILVPLLALWVLALFDILVKRSDLSIGWKGIWSATVIFVPYVGVLIYAFVRPPAQAKRFGSEDPTTTGQAIDQIHHLVADHETGAITDEQFATQKALIFGIASP